MVPDGTRAHAVRRLQDDADRGMRVDFPVTFFCNAIMRDMKALGDNPTAGDIHACIENVCHQAKKLGFLNLDQAIEGALVCSHAWSHA